MLFKVNWVVRAREVVFVVICNLTGNEHSLSGWWGTEYSFSFLLSSTFIPSEIGHETNRGRNECCIGPSMHTTTLISFISSIQAVVVEFSVAELQTCLSQNQIFLFIHHLRVISPKVSHRLRSFWSYLKGNWKLYNMMWITQTL